MSQNEELVSALMDGESSDSSAVKKISQSAELAEKWQRYHLIRSTMRGERATSLELDITAAVAEQLDQEPVVLAPIHRRKVFGGRVSAKVVPMFRQVSQYAVAASVAVAVIVGVQQYNQPAEVQGLDGPGLITMPGGHLSPVSLEQTKVVPTTTNNNIERQRRMNAYLLDHQQQLRLKQNKANEADENQPPQPEK